MVPIIGLLLLAGGALGIMSCGGGGDSENNTSTGGTGGSGGVGGKDSGTVDGDEEDAGEAGDATAEGGVKPGNRPGMNDEFATPSYSGSLCPILDIDISGQQMRIMCGYPVNRLGTADLSSSDAMTTSPVVFGSGNQGSVGLSLSGYGNVNPVQVQPLSNGVQLVPFSSNKGSDAAADTINGLAFIASSGDVKTNLIDTITFSGNFEIHPVNIQTALISQERLWIPVSESITGQGLLLSYALRADGTINHNDVKLPILTTGNRPSAMAEIDAHTLAVLNTSGASGATLDIITTDSVDPAKAVTATIGLNVDEVVSLAELSVTDDKKYALIAARGGNGLNRVIVVDLVGHKVAGTIDIGSGGTIRGIDLKGTQAFVSIDDGKTTPSSGRVATVDFSNVAAPKVVGEPLIIGNDIGAVAAHSSGIVFTAVTDRWWEVPGSTTTRFANVVAFDPTKANNVIPVADAGVDGGDADASGE